MRRPWFVDQAPFTLRKTWGRSALVLSRWELLAVLAVAPVLLFSPRYAPFAAIVVLSFWLLRLISRKHIDVADPLVRPAYGLLLMGIIALYPSIDLSLSLAKLWSLLLSLAIYLALVNVRRRGTVVSAVAWIIPGIVTTVGAISVLG